MGAIALAPLVCARACVPCAFVIVGVRAAGFSASGAALRSARQVYGCGSERMQPRVCARGAGCIGAIVDRAVAASASDTVVRRDVEIGSRASLVWDSSRKSILALRLLRDTI